MGHNETVMCVEGQVVSLVYPDEGLILTDLNELARMLCSTNVWFIPRPVAEDNPKYRQIIPYVILRCGDLIGTYRRTPHGGESRLHESYSIGFGGHIGLRDVVLDGEEIDAWSTVECASVREVGEEVQVFSLQRQTLLGVIVDNSTRVSRVHVGIAQVWDLAETHLKSLESAVTECRFLPADELEALALESWSTLCARALDSVDYSSNVITY